MSSWARRTPALTVPSRGGTGSALEPTVCETASPRCRSSLPIQGKERAETSLAAERARADALRDRIEAMQAQLAAAEAEGTESDVEAAELTAQLKQARGDAQAAAQAADALRQGRCRTGGEGAPGAAEGRVAGGMTDLPARVGPVEFGRLGGWVAKLEHRYSPAWTRTSSACFP